MLHDGRSVRVARGQTMGDVALGAVIKHSRDWNLARESVIDSGLTLRTPGMDLQRACGTSIEAAILIANKIALGQIDCGIAGGTDTVSDAPIVFRDEFRHIVRRRSVSCHGSGCAQSTLRRSSRTLSNHAPVFQWAKAWKRRRKNGTCSVSTRTSSRSPVT
jgi:acetyl-CoA acetyltransferase